MDENQLTKQFRTKDILLYALPTIFTMVFMATYMIVDGMFVAKYVDEFAFSALNIAYPLISSVVALGLMLSIGSSAIIGKLLGEGKMEKARGFFSQTYVVGIVLGLTVAFLTQVFMDDILRLLQVEGILYDYTYDYLYAYHFFFTLNILQIFAQTFFITVGKPLIGFSTCFLGGMTNIIFDYIFIAQMDMGVKGASYGTALGNAVPGIFALLYFLTQRKGILFLEKFKWDWKGLVDSCVNGSSELVTNLAVAITTFLFNVIMLDWLGEAGVASITAILYIQMFQMGVYTGYSFGVAPLISYKYGAKDDSQVKLIVKVSLLTMLISSVVVVALSYLFADQALSIFIPPDSETFPIAKEGMFLYTSAYIFMGINVFISSMFTAFSNGKISAILSCTRTLLLIVSFLLLLPQLIGINGVWIAVPLAELCSIFMGIYFLKKFKQQYHY